MTSHYEVLGVDPEASHADIRRAYLGLARLHHPDVVASADAATRAMADRRMRDANRAWHVLGDPQRRQAYDRSLGVGAVDDGGDRFRPFDTGEDPDPRHQPDVPYRHDPAAGTLRRRVTTLAPVVLFLAAVAVFAGSLVLASVVLFALSVVLLVASALGFVIVPLLALSRAKRDEG